jgi:diguanylate cyclase (GGDEF)-like protein
MIAQSIKPAPRLARCFEVAIAGFAGAYVLWLLLSPGGEDGVTWFTDLASMTAALISGLLICCAALFMEGRGRLSWMLIGLGALSWGLGEVVWDYYELLAGRETPFPSLADAGYLAMIPLVLLGLVLLPARGAQAGERLKVALDAGIIMACVAAVSWFAVLGPMYAEADATATEKIIGLAYPAGDVVLMCALIGGVARGWIMRSASILPLLAGGIVAFIVADLGFAFLTVHDAYFSGNPGDLGWPVGFLLIAAAALRQWSSGESDAYRRQFAFRELRGREPIADVLRQVAPYVLVLIVAVLMLSNLRSDGITRDAFMAAALGTVLLVMARQFITFRENEQLTRVVSRMAYHDSLTGLPNRRLMEDHLQIALALGRRHKQKFAVMAVDLDRFKAINDTHGHDAGDYLLRVVAERLGQSIRKSDTAARLGGDEFLVLLWSPITRETAEGVAERMAELMVEPIVFDNGTLQVGSSIGVSLYPEDGTDAPTLLRAADRAMYRAKESGPNRVCFAADINPAPAQPTPAADGPAQPVRTGG